MGSLSWHDINLLYWRELRAALRERAIVVNSILLPIFLYPVILWLMFSAFAFVEGLSEGRVSRVALVDLPARHAAIADSLRSLSGVELRTEPAALDPAIEAVRNEELDAAVAFESPPPTGAGVSDNFQARIYYDRSVDRGRRAAGRVETVISAYRGRWLEEEALSRGVTPGEMEVFRIESENVATGREVGAFVLAQMVPLFLVIMVALGCFYPAIDSTAGERERSTWETSMTVAASRGSLVTAKYLYVATLGTAAGILNVLAVVAAMGGIMGPLLGDRVGDIQFQLPATAVPLMLLGALVLALFFAAAMMVLASFARTFKDGQAMITPVYYLALTPLILTGAPDLALSPKMALVPIANLALMIKDAISGVYVPVLIAESVLINAALIVLCLWAARAILGFEDYVMGSYDGSFWRFMKERVLTRGTVQTGETT